MNKEEWQKEVKKRKHHGPFYYEVYDEFLPEIEFAQLKQYLGKGGDFPWYTSPHINLHDVNGEDFYFATLVFNNAVRAKQEWSQGIVLEPFVNITSKLHINALIRIKANMYFKIKNEVDIHAPHVDYDYFHNGALFFLTNCNAPTLMADGTEIESKENRLLLFNSATPHSSSAPTDKLFRQTININYFGGGVNAKYTDTARRKLVVSKHEKD